MSEESQRNTYASMFIAAFFTTVEIMKSTYCPLKDA
jgi:hypothetical protein